MRKALRRLVKASFPTLALFVTPQTLFAQPIIQFQEIITGLDQPIEVVTAPGDLTGRLFIVEKHGVVRIWNGTSLLATPFLDMSGIVLDEDEQGLLSMAFHPQYATNGFFFVYYNSNSGNITVARYQVSGNPNIANTTSNPVSPIISISKPATNHNGGHIQFKVQGGVNYLYLATGDGGSSNNPSNSSQDPGSSLGKMIRINTDNLAAPHVKWAWGLRNPFKWSFDRLNGDVYLGDVGQGLKEEVSYRAEGTFGANYGWVCFEGNLDNRTNAPTGSQCDTVESAHVPPIFTYNNPTQGAASIVGGYVYRGTEYSDLYGYYITVDFYSGQLRLIKKNGASWNVLTQTGLPNMISSISETYDGTTLYATQLITGVVYKVISSGVVLPVRVTDFSGIARNGFNELRWTTESEQNIDRYTVEFSRDGSNYLNAGDVVSFNNNNRNTYAFRHDIASAKVFYRLQIKEQTGHSQYSPIITVGENDRSGSMIYPTVIADRIINILAAQPVDKIQMMNSDGRQVYSRVVNSQTGYFSMDIPNVGKGVYFIRLTGRNFSQTGKVIVQ